MIAKICVHKAVAIGKTIITHFAFGGQPLLFPPFLLPFKLLRLTIVKISVYIDSDQWNLNRDIYISNIRVMGEIMPKYF